MKKHTEALRKKSPAELREELLSLRREHFNLRMQRAAQQNERTSELRRVRRTIARVLTLMTEQAAASPAAAGTAAAAASGSKEAQS